MLWVLIILLSPVFLWTSTGEAVSDKLLILFFFLLSHVQKKKITQQKEPISCTASEKALQQRSSKFPGQHKEVKQDKFCLQSVSHSKSVEWQWAFLQLPKDCNLYTYMVEVLKLTVHD